MTVIGASFPHLPAGLVYAGVSLGVMPAQKLAGDGHLLADNSLPDYYEAVANLLEQRVLALAEVE